MMTGQLTTYSTSVQELTIAEKERHVDNVTPILKAMALTPYACSELEQLSGGLVNLTYRGFLSQPLPDGSRSIFIKLTKDYTLIPGASFSVDRCIYEQEVLTALSSGLSPIIQDNGIVARTPSLYYFFPQDNIQIMEDLQNTTTLLPFIRSSVGNSLSPAVAKSLGHALGAWLGSFHARTFEMSGSYWLHKIDRNHGARNSMNNLLYGFMKQKMMAYPRLFEGIEHKLWRCVEEQRGRDVFGVMGLCHGDFSLRKYGEPFVTFFNQFIANFPSVLISNTPSTRQDILLAPIDWEACHYGPQYHDLSQIISDIYILHTSGVDPDLCILKSMISSYNAVNEELAFQVTTSVGIYLIDYAWIIAAPCTIELEERLVRVGIDLILKGRAKDRQSLEGGFLGCLFRNCA